MSSKLATHQNISRVNNSSKQSYNISNYQQIPSKLERQKYYQENKTDIDKYEGLKKEAEELQKEKMSGDNFSEEEYEKVYNEMKEELKAFFKSPTELKEEKSGRIASNTTAIENEIATATQKKQEAYTKYPHHQQNQHQQITPHIQTQHPHQQNPHLIQNPLHHQNKSTTTTLTTHHQQNQPKHPHHQQNQHRLPHPSSNYSHSTTNKQTSPPPTTHHTPTITTHHYH